MLHHELILRRETGLQNELVPSVPLHLWNVWRHGQSVSFEMDKFNVLSRPPVTHSCFVQEGQADSQEGMAKTGWGSEEWGVWKGRVKNEVWVTVGAEVGVLLLLPLPLSSLPSPLLSMLSLLPKTFSSDIICLPSSSVLSSPTQQITLLVLKKKERKKNIRLTIVTVRSNGTSCLEE